MLRLLIHLFFVTLIILDGIYVASQNYANCLQPSYSCSNGVEVSYPFWMENDAETNGYFCGYRDLSISCEEGERGGRSVINISNHLYYVLGSDYDGDTFTMLDVDIDGSECPQPRHNFSLDTTTAFLDPGSRTRIYYNCSKYPQHATGYYHIPCLDQVGGNRRSFLLGSYDKGGLNWNGDCEKMVDIPYLVNVPDILNYTETLSSGFSLDLSMSDSGQCEDSGGHNLFNETTGAYHCFCFHNYTGVYESVCPSSDKVSNRSVSTPTNISNRTVSTPTNISNRSVSTPTNISTPTDISTGGMSIRLKIIIGVCTGFGASLLILILLLSYRRIWFSTCCLVKDQSNVEVFLENCGHLAAERYKYSDIKKMTYSFKEKLGQGGYGSVFKGKIRDSRLVAVKVLNASKSNGEDFINEVATISRTNHVNVVNLLGFCSEGTKRALVYEFMPNGSLEKFIYNTKSLASPSLLLGWEKLYQIALGIAKGLEYLHRGCNTRILHFDIKPHNILLDEDFCPKIADFGLAKLCPTKESIVSMLVARGTMGYIAPEVYCRNFGGVSHKSDVYSYGMMVLEMIGGRKNIDASVENMSEIYFPQWIYNHFKLDVSVDGCGDIFEDLNARKMITVALWCIQTQPSSRPSIAKVVEMLEGNNEELEMPPSPFQDPPSNSSP